MPDSLSDLFHRGERLSERAPVFEATVAAGAGGLNGTVTVTIDAFDGGQQRWPVDGWNPRGDTYPKRGDRCLVTMSDANRLWLLQWAPGGGGRGPGGRDPRPEARPRLDARPAVLVGTPKNIIDNVVLPMAILQGIGITPEDVDAANHAHSPISASGNTSDHAGPPDVRWAADMSNGVETPEEDALAEMLADEFDIPWSGSGGPKVRHNGYQFQLIYRTSASSVYGDHTDHVHFGVHII